VTAAHETPNNRQPGTDGEAARPDRRNEGNPGRAGAKYGGGDLGGAVPLGRREISRLLVARMFAVVVLAMALFLLLLLLLTLDTTLPLISSTLSEVPRWGCGGVMGIGL